MAASAVAASLLAGVVISASPAEAVGGSCFPSLYKRQVSGGLDEYRAGAYCSSLEPDSKARPKLIRNSGPDYSGPYFTRLYTIYFTNWYTCYAGCSAAVESAHV